jgi:hypothetical protein
MEVKDGTEVKREECGDANSLLQKKHRMRPAMGRAAGAVMLGAALLSSYSNLAAGTTPHHDCVGGVPELGDETTTNHFADRQGRLHLSKRQRKAAEAAAAVAAEQAAKAWRLAFSIPLTCTSLDLGTKCVPVFCFAPLSYGFVQAYMCGGVVVGDRCCTHVTAPTRSSCTVRRLLLAQR